MTKGIRQVARIAVGLALAVALGGCSAAPGSQGESVRASTGSHVGVRQVAVSDVSSYDFTTCTTFAMETFTDAQTAAINCIQNIPGAGYASAVRVNNGAGGQTDFFEFEFTCDAIGDCDTPGWTASSASPTCADGTACTPCDDGSTCNVYSGNTCADGSSCDPCGDGTRCVQPGTDDDDPAVDALVAEIVKCGTDNGVSVVAATGHDVASNACVVSPSAVRIAAFGDPGTSGGFNLQ